MISSADWPAEACQQIDSAGFNGNKKCLVWIYELFQGFVKNCSWVCCSSKENGLGVVYCVLLNQLRSKCFRYTEMSYFNSCCGLLVPRVCDGSALGARTGMSYIKIKIKFLWWDGTQYPMVGWYTITHEECWSREWAMDQHWGLGILNAEASSAKAS